MTDLRSAIEQGHYARKQILSRDRLVAWSHSRRFDTAVSLARAFREKRLLDYGCGDGTFLALTMMTPDAPSLAVGAELSVEAIDDCRRRYRDEPRLRVRARAGPRRELHIGHYDAVFCMEVFEHVVDWDPELERLERLLAPGGRSSSACRLKQACRW